MAWWNRNIRAWASMSINLLFKQSSESQSITKLGRFIAAAMWQGIPQSCGTIERHHEEIMLRDTLLASKKALTAMSHKMESFTRYCSGEVPCALILFQNPKPKQSLSGKRIVWSSAMAPGDCPPKINRMLNAVWWQGKQKLQRFACSSDFWRSLVGRHKPHLHIDLLCVEE